MRKVRFLSLIWPILSPSWSPIIGLLQAVLALRHHARGNAAAQPEDVPLLKEGELFTVR
jgi:hypothetical protein